MRWGFRDHLTAEFATNLGNRHVTEELPTSRGPRGGTIVRSQRRGGNLVRLARRGGNFGTKSTEFVHRSATSRGISHEIATSRGFTRENATPPIGAAWAAQRTSTSALVTCSYPPTSHSQSSHPSTTGPNTHPTTTCPTTHAPTPTRHPKKDKEKAPASPGYQGCEGFSLSGDGGI